MTSESSYPGEHPSGTPAPHETRAFDSTEAVPYHSPTPLTAVTIILCLMGSFISGGLGLYMVADENVMAMLIGLIAFSVALLDPLWLAKCDKEPEKICIRASIVTALLPCGPAYASAAMASLLAHRRHGRTRLLTALAAASIVVTSFRDALLPSTAGVIPRLMAPTDETNTPIGDLPWPAIIMYEAICAAAWIALGILIGLNHRHRALEKAAEQRNAVEQTKTEKLRTVINDQQFADSVAAEAHDTLAHSLSLIALNANVLKMKAETLQQLQFSDDRQLSDGAKQLLSDISVASENIRRQAAGALDETHTIINVLRDPQGNAVLLGPSSETSLSYQSLSDLINDARSSGMPLDTWIDVHDFNAVDPQISKLAYRAIQEGLTNARRHAPGRHVDLSVTCSRDKGIAIHFSNTIAAQSGAAPVNPATPVASAQSAQHPNAMPQSAPAQGHVPGGNGLAGLCTRIERLGGTASWGVDWRNVFHVDIALPLAPLPLKA